ncbi:hypothetical protein ASD11_01425 [Aeromicrobium sp. Root495]|uniref:hypothetical protein n=1 Tax=Aeromicrobium sp. Root495 TaxID=1736550 RepID=UPI0006FEF06F|nr:hypothetical protein [Aeromicrobium sp. Root495]KQY58356.1 hypothetical protein ASD11_01425 [Aeromicrobium sp. Root495]
MNDALQRFLGLIRPDKVFVLQHAHCGHIALKSGRRASIETAHRIAFSRGMHAWRVRLEPKNPPLGTCDKCQREAKALTVKAGRRGKAPVTA